MLVPYKESVANNRYAIWKLCTLYLYTYICPYGTALLALTDYNIIHVQLYMYLCHMYIRIYMYIISLDLSSNTFPFIE